MALGKPNIPVLLNLLTAVCRHLVFLLCALSALPGREQVSSNKAIVFVYLFNNTKSGFEPIPADTRMSAGIVVPFTWKLGRSSKTSVSHVVKLFTIVVI